MDYDLTVAVVGGWIVWAMTYLTRTLVPEGEFKQALRHWTPEIAAVLAVAIVGAWQVFDGAEVWSAETLRRALSAACAAVFGHSLVKEKMKMMEKRGSGGGGGKGLERTLLVVPLVLVFGCGGGAVQGLDYLPDVQIKNADGCPDVSIRQPLPAPEGWSVMTETRIQKECPPTPEPPPSPEPQPE